MYSRSDTCLAGWQESGRARIVNRSQSVSIRAQNAGEKNVPENLDEVPQV